MKRTENTSRWQKCEATGTRIYCQRECSSCYYSRLQTALWLLVQATILANQGNPSIRTWTIKHEMLYVQGDFQDGPESTGYGTTKSPDLALCSPASKMSTLPACSLAPHLTSQSWQDFSQQKVDPALFKEHMGQALTRCPPTELWALR